MLINIISQLKQRKLIEKLPKDHHVYRREQQHKEYIKLSKEKYYNPEGPYLNINKDNLIFISNSDIELPEIEEILEKINKEALRKDSIDALAWYRSFHWEPTKYWGIYILDAGIFLLARLFSGIKQKSKYGRPYNTLDYIIQAFKLLFLHEFFHFITDIAASILEIGNPLSRPFYIDYIHNVYMKPKNKNEPIEEALANAFAINRIKEFKKFIRLFFSSIKANGYCAFDRYLSNKKFTNGRRNLGTCIRDGKNTSDVSPLESLFDIYKQDIYFRDVPIYIVNTFKDDQYIIKFLKKFHTIELSKSYSRDFDNLTKDIKKKALKAKNKLEINPHHPSLRLEKIKGCDVVFSYRIDKNYRGSIQLIDGKGLLLRIAKHDKLYRNPGGC
jgi:hypothetical protein